MDRRTTCGAAALVAALLAFLSACGGGGGSGAVPDAFLEVDHQRGACVGLVERNCLRVRTSPDAPWQPQFDPIEGFVFERGVTARLRVRHLPVPAPPEDAASVRTVMVAQERTPVPPDTTFTVQTATRPTDFVEAGALRRLADAMFAVNDVVFGCGGRQCGVLQAAAQDGLPLRLVFDYRNRPPEPFHLVSIAPVEPDRVPNFTPRGLAVDLEGHLYVADVGAPRSADEQFTLGSLRRFAPDGTTDTLGTFSAGFQRFAAVPGSVHVTMSRILPESGAVVANCTVMQFAPTNPVAPAVRLAEPSGDAEPCWSRLPSAVQIFNREWIVTDARTGELRRFAADGSATTIATGFDRPSGLAITATLGRTGIPGDVTYHVADTGSHAIRAVTNAVVSTLAGAPGMPGHADGRGASARFNRPEAIILGPNGDFYVADMGNHVVRRVRGDGTVSTMAGVPGEAGHVDGRADQARFSSPADLAMDLAGNVYVSDAGNNAVRRIDRQGMVTTILRRR